MAEANSEERFIGADVRRLEDPRLITGRGRYVADIYRPGELHMAVVRSIYPHARLEAVDIGPALGVAGVVAAFSAKNIGSYLRPIPIRRGFRPGLEHFLQYPLARDRVRYVGEPVAIVLAESCYAAQDGVEQVRVSYDPLPPIANVDDALADGAAQLFDDRSNRVSQYVLSTGDVDQALREADVIIEDEFRVHRHTAAPLETRGLVAEFDPEKEALTVWGATKKPHENRAILASLLGMPESKIHLIETDVGGGFGVRGEFYPEDFLVPLAAILSGRPVRWIEDRWEHMLAANHSREQHWRVAVGARRDGTIVGIRAVLFADMGAYMRTHGTLVPFLSGAMLLGPYKIPHYRCEVNCVLTNKTPIGTYRAPGRYEANFVRERLLDMLALRLEMDRMKLRFRNLIPPEEMPYDVGLSVNEEQVIYDSGDYPALLRTLLKAVDYESFHDRKAAARKEGRFIGLGIAPFVEKSGLGPFECARVHIASDGRVSVYTGAASLGQGHETTLSQICGEVLQLSPEMIAVVHGDTDAIASGIGTFASRGAVMAGSAVWLAAQELKSKLLEAAAGTMDLPPEDLDLAGGAVRVKSHPERRIDFEGLAASLSGMEISAEFQAKAEAYPYGASAAIVEVDPEVGTVGVQRFIVACDVGRMINPTIVRGQLIGGLVQGIGGTLLEELAYSNDAQPLATSFMDYLLPTSTDVPDVEVIIREDWPTPLNPLGVKGVGEVGIAAVGAAIANAVADALSEFDPHLTELPLKPDRVVSLISKQKPR
ncbi:MAG: xanthine dehydrogenase family protein molybdopterin-binding subunit [Dehalococcoidia bacterium]